MRALTLLSLLYPSLISTSLDVDPAFTISQLYLYKERKSRELEVLEAARQASMLNNLTPLQELSLYIPEAEYQYGQDHPRDDDTYGTESESTSETGDENGEYWEFP